MQRAGTAAELAVKNQERQPPKVIAVQMGDGDSHYLVWLQAESFEADERARPTVDEKRLRHALASDMQACLQPPAGAESITGSSHAHPYHIPHTRKCVPRQRLNASRAREVLRAQGSMRRHQTGAARCVIDDDHQSVNDQRVAVRRSVSQPKTTRGRTR